MSPAKRKASEAREAKRRAQTWRAKKQLHEARRALRKRDNIIGIVAGVIVVGLATLSTIGYLNADVIDAAASSSSATATASATASGNTGDVPDAAGAEDRTWTGEMTINGSPVQISLDGAAAPQAVASFVHLVQSDFYNNLTCHRLVDETDFHILQCGDPNGDGTGGPDYRFGPIENAPADNLYVTGTLAMARQSDNAYSQGSQFFIVFGDSTIPADSAGGYTVFGQITAGIDTIQSIAAAGVTSGTTTPVNPVTISQITVE